MVSPFAKILVTLMYMDPKRRLGSGERGILDILTQHWFNRVDWGAVETETSEPPIYTKAKRRR